MTEEKQREIHKQYSKLNLSVDKSNTIDECYRCSINYNGHVLSIEKLMNNPKEVKKNDQR